MADTKVGLTIKIVDWINKIRPAKKEKVTTRKSRFEGFLRHGEKEGKKGVVVAVGLCDEALDIVTDRIALINRLKLLEERMAEVECYGELADGEAGALKDLLGRYSDLAKECNDLKYQLTSFDKSIARMEHLSEEAQKDLPEIKFAEERQRIFKEDIGHIEGEKIALEHERARLKNAVDFVYKFSVAMVIFFGGLTLITVALHIFREAQVVLTLFIMVAVAFILMAMIYALRHRLRYELWLNFKKQERAIELLNKKNAVYAHFTNYLNYEYDRFRVADSEMLSNNLTDYEKYKGYIKRLGSLHEIMTQAETAINSFLADKGIDAKFSSMEKFASTINVDDKKQFYVELRRDKAAIEKSLADLDAQSSRIWDTLVNLRYGDARDSDIIGKLMENYTEKADYLLNVDRVQGTTAIDSVMDDKEFEFMTE